MTSGPIVRKDGEVLGEHQGLSNYTIGQRKGLGVSYSEPLYVLAMNPYRNALVVGTRDELGRDTCTVTRVNWVSGEIPSDAFTAEVKIRYKARPQPALVEPIEDGRMRITFNDRQRDITPGQGAVIYQGDVCLGGGNIEKFSESILETT